MPMNWTPGCHGRSVVAEVDRPLRETSASARQAREPVLSRPSVRGLALGLAWTSLLCGLMTVACMSREEKLFDQRHRLRESLEKLYTAYGGAELASDGRKPARATGEAAQPLNGLVSRFVEGAERAHFDEFCLAIGRGQRPFALSRKLDDFMKKSENVRACRDAAKLQLAIDALEREVGVK